MIKYWIQYLVYNCSKKVYSKKSKLFSQIKVLTHPQNYNLIVLIDFKIDMQPSVSLPKLYIKMIIVYSLLKKVNFM